MRAGQDIWLGRSGPPRRRQVRWDERTADDAFMVTDAPLTGREYEIEFSKWTGELPSPQEVGHVRTERNGALSGAGFRHADGEVAIGALTYANLPALEVDVPPRQPAQLAGA